jgi:DNA gyrase subunit A
MITFITGGGRAYYMKAHEIPEAQRVGKGVHIKSLLQLTPGDEIATVISFGELAQDHCIFMATARGVVKKTPVGDFSNARTKGVAAIKLDEGDRLVTAIETSGKDEVVLVSRKGKALRYSEELVRPMGRASRGVTGIKLDDEDELAGLIRVMPNEKVLILTEYGYGKRVDLSEFNSHGRGTGGQRIYGVSDKTGEISGCVGVGEDDEIMAITSQGKSIKVAVGDIRVMGNSAQGVKILTIEKPDFVIGVDRIVKEDAEAKPEGA